MPTTEETRKADQKVAQAAGPYREELEKYHIAGQSYMEAPKPPEAGSAPKESEPVPVTVGDRGTILERDVRLDHDRWKQKPGRISPEDALRLAAENDEHAPSAGGYYYAVAEEPEGDEDDEKKKPKPTQPPQQPQPTKQPEPPKRRE